MKNEKKKVERILINYGHLFTNKSHENFELKLKNIKQSLKY